MTLPPFVDGNILYADELNQLRLELKADATQKANAARNGAATDATAKDDVLKAHLEAYADDQDDIVRSDAAADATAKDDVLKARLDILERDTGWRNISSILAPGWQIGGFGGLLIRRVGHQVLVQASNVQRSEPTIGSAVDLCAFPAGFRPYANSRYAYTLLGSAGCWFANISSLATLQLRDISGTGVTGSSLQQSFSYDTTQPWPSTLPGTPA